MLSTHQEKVRRIEIYGGKRMKYEVINNVNYCATFDTYEEAFEFVKQHENENTEFDICEVDD